MKRYTDEVLLATTGIPVVDALVTVLLTGTETPATLYETNDVDGPTMDNPVPTGSEGLFYFYVADGTYDLTVTSGTRSITLPAVEIYDLDELHDLATPPIVADIGTVTVSTPVTDLQETWNNAAVDFIGERRRVTGMAYNIASVGFSFEFNGDRTFSWKPRGDLRIGAYGDGVTNAGVAVTRSLFDGETTSTHGFGHTDLIRRGGTIGNASFDANPTLQSNNYDHHAGFQDRPVFQFNAGQAVSNIYSLYSAAFVDTGSATNRYGGYVAAPVLSNAANITNQYGYYVESLTTAGTNYAFYSAGITRSHFGGPVTIGNYGGGSTDPGLVISRDLNDGIVGNGHGFVEASYFRRAGMSAFAAFDAATSMVGNSYDHFAAFQARPAIQFAFGAQTMSNCYGLYSYALVDSGLVTNLYHGYAAAPTLANGGRVTNQYGFYVESLTGGTSNYAFYSAGITPSRFGFVTVNGAGAYYELVGNAATDTSFYAQVAGDDFARATLGVTAAGAAQMSFGPGNSNRDWILRRTAAGVAKALLADGATLASLQVKLRTEANAVTETIVPTKTLILYDAAGVAYKVPCFPA